MKPRTTLWLLGAIVLALNARVLSAQTLSSTLIANGTTAGACRDSINECCMQFSYTPAAASNRLNVTLVWDTLCADPSLADSCIDWFCFEAQSTPTIQYGTSGFDRSFSIEGTFIPGQTYTFHICTKSIGTCYKHFYWNDELALSSGQILPRTYGYGQTGWQCKN